MTAAVQNPKFCAISSENKENMNRPPLPNTNGSGTPFGRLTGKVHSRCFSCQAKMVTNRGNSPCQLCNGYVGDGSEIHEIRTVTFCTTCMENNTIWNALVVGMETLSPGAYKGVDRHNEAGVKIYACQKNGGCWNRLRREKLLNMLRAPPPPRPSAKKPRKSSLAKAAAAGSNNSTTAHSSMMALTHGALHVSGGSAASVGSDSSRVEHTEDDIFALLSLRAAPNPAALSTSGEDSTASKTDSIPTIKDDDVSAPVVHIKGITLQRPSIDMSVGTPVIPRVPVE